MADKAFQSGNRVTVYLTEKHELQRRFDEAGDAVEHEAIFLRLHPDKEWADVLLDKEHAGGTRLLSVPVSVLKKV